MSAISSLWTAPDVNPINRKARSIPFLNVANVYGRVFFFSWFGFMVAFWAWYTFPPLLSHSIKADLKLSAAEVANSNIVSLCATLLVRLVAGPLCDQFGPRKVFAGTLLLGSIPLGLAPLVNSANGLYASRFFIGILGGSFVPCLVWSTGFFDKNVVGTANAFTGGWGNAGGGITYFIMPAVYDSFVAHGHTSSQSWRLTFIVPLVVVICTGIALLLCCPDTPVGKWADRKSHVQENLHAHGINTPTESGMADPIADGAPFVNIPGNVTQKLSTEKLDNPSSPVDDDYKRKEAKLESNGQRNLQTEHEAVMSESDMLQTARGEVVVAPSLKETLKVAISVQTWFHMLTYACSFGAELAINSILSTYYTKNFPSLGQTGSANWAAMFGFLNFVTRPLGGIIADLLYNMSGHNLWLKKAWINVCGVTTGILLIIIGKTDPHHLPTFIGLIALMAIFLEAGNGANFALIPHVHPHANGIVSGFTGGVGNLGGIVFAIIFRFMDGGTNYAKAFLVIGCIHVGINVAGCWIRPIPKGQIGGR